MSNLNGSALAASLTVNDIQASLAWYRDVFGFAVDRNYEREGKLMAVSLKAGEVRSRARVPVDLRAHAAVVRLLFRLSSAQLPSAT